MTDPVTDPVTGPAPDAAAHPAPHPGGASALWRVRTTLPDRPGSLAALARRCGEAEVNILGLQVFPGVEAVTDELVLRTPVAWGTTELAALVESAGGRAVSAAPCTEGALVDQPTRYVQAARTVLAAPAAFPEALARLLDAEADRPEGPGALAPLQDVLEVAVGEVQVQVRRTAPFTATEHARAAAVADLVADVLARSQADRAAVPAADRRLGGGAVPAYERDEAGVRAVVDGVLVGAATLRAEVEPGVREVGLRVDPGWRRRGIGARLLVEVTRVAGATGARELLLTTDAGNQAVLPMVLAAGLRGRIRLAADVLTVRVPVRDLRPARS